MRRKVICIGRGNKGEGCGPVEGVSGGVCMKCGGMLLSRKEVKEAEALAESFILEIKERIKDI